LCGSRLALRDRVRAYMCTAHGAWCPVSKGRGQFGRSLHRRGKKFQPVGARCAFKRVVFLSIDSPHICSPRPPPSPLICDCRRSWFVFVVWVTVEQSLTDGWEYTVRSRTMTRIRIASSIYATTPRQENSIQDTRVITKSIRDRTRHRQRRKSTAVQVVHVFYPDSALGALSRFCCRLPLFEVLGSRSLMIWPNGVPTSFSPLRNPSSLFLKVSYALLVA